MTTDKNRPSRIALIDAARGLALLAMAVYHFTWDLEFFGYVSQGTTTVGGWRLFARAIASSFLMLAGFSLFLAHEDTIRWRSFAKRLVMIGVAAATITVATRFATPDSYIFFGILHCIAVSSLVGLLFVKLPSLLTALAGCALIFVMPEFAGPPFDHPASLWLGLSGAPVRSNDFVPLVPWMGPFLLGMAAAQSLSRNGMMTSMVSIYRGADTISTALRFAGRHSLAVYLIHQPVLIGTLYLFNMVVPVDPVIRFNSECNYTCTLNNDAEFCVRFCDCAAERLIELELLDAVLGGSAPTQSDPEIQKTVQQCTAKAIMAPEQ